jgi:predicted amino acid dehydrogenase
MLPSLGGLGVRDPIDVVTTGHAATVAAMFLTVRRVLRDSGREWTRAHVAALGFGSIGQATFALCRALLGEPASLRVIDPSVSHVPWGALATTIEGCDLVIAASSGGATLDVDALAPGTIVVDDSFPRAFSDERAWARMRTRKDVLLVGGGMLDVGALVRRSPFAEADSVRRGLPVRWLPGCHAEAFVLALRPELGPTRGLVDVTRARAMLDALQSLGVREAPLHLGPDEVNVTL